nr:PIN domain-containing protein [Candidatus Sigynarchaeum springense]
MKLVIDTNRIIAALIKDSTNRKVLFCDLFDFYTPQETLNEIRKYKEVIIKKAKITSDEYELLFQQIILRIHVVDIDAMMPKLEEAGLLMKDIDPKDKWFIAVGMALDLDGIWTEDKHFSKQATLKPLATKSLLALISRKVEDPV